MNQIVRCDLGADLIHARENSNKFGMDVLKLTSQTTLHRTVFLVAHG